MRPIELTIKLTNHPGQIAITEALDLILFWKHWGDTGMSRPMPTSWHRGGMVKPSCNGSIHSNGWKKNSRELLSALGFTSDFSGDITFHLNGGKAIRADVN